LVLDNSTRTLAHQPSQRFPNCDGTDVRLPLGKGDEKSPRQEVGQVRRGMTLSEQVDQISKSRKSGRLVGPIGGIQQVLRPPSGRPAGRTPRKTLQRLGHIAWLDVFTRLNLPTQSAHGRPLGMPSTQRRHRGGGSFGQTLGSQGLAGLTVPSFFDEVRSPPPPSLSTVPLFGQLFARLPELTTFTLQPPLKVGLSLRFVGVFVFLSSPNRRVESTLGQHEKF
jgi:hypothetical protein